VTVTSTSGTPTGDVSLIAPTSVNGGIGNATLSGGSVNITGIILPGGSYNVNARYAGDTTFASSTSSPGVPVLVSKENSHLQYSIVTFDVVTNAVTNINATSVAYGSPYILRFDILNSLGTATNCRPVVVAGGTRTTAGCAFDATGTVSITDTFNGSTGPLDTSPFPVNSAGSGEDQPIQLLPGSHALSATYSGDISYNPVAVAVLDSVTVTKAVTATTVVPNVTSVVSGGSVILTATVATNSSGAGPTGTVQFKNGSNNLGTMAVPCAPTAATATAFAFCTATLTTPLSFMAPPSAPSRFPNFRYQPVLLTALLLLLLFLFSLNRVSPTHRRTFTLASLLLLVFVLAGIAGCSGHGGSGRIDNITAAYSGDTNYTGSTSPAVPITIQ
jgi:hypothetical protein